MSKIYQDVFGILPQVFFSVMFGAMQLGQAGPNFADIATAQGAAYQVFLVIDRVINLITCSNACLVSVNMVHWLSVLHACRRHLSICYVTG